MSLIGGIFEVSPGAPLTRKFLAAVRYSAGDGVCPFPAERRCVIYGDLYDHPGL